MKQCLILIFFLFFLRVQAQQPYFDRVVGVDLLASDSVSSLDSDIFIYRNNILFERDDLEYSFSIADEKWIICPQDLSTKIKETAKSIAVEDPKLEKFGAGTNLVLEISMPRFRKNEDGNIEQLAEYTVRRSLVSTKSAMVQASSFTTKSVLASGEWIKISVTGKGVCKISYSTLTKMGITSPDKVAVYGNGGYMLPKLNSEAASDDLVKNRVIHAKDASGENCIFFYSSGTTQWTYDSDVRFFEHSLNLYSDKLYFYLTDDLTPSETPEKFAAPSDAPESIVNTFDYLDFVEKESYNLLSSGRTWYGDRFQRGGSKSYTFAIESPITGGTSRVKVAAVARSGSATSIGVTANGQSSGSLNFSSTDITYTYADYAKEASGIFSFTASSSENIILNYVGSSSDDVAWLDYITLNSKAWLKFKSDPLIFRSRDQLTSSCLGYKVDGLDANTLIWDVTDPLNVVEMSRSSNDSYSFSAEGGKISEYVVFSPLKGSFLAPTVEKSSVANQNIHGAESPEMVIVSHPDFLSQSEELAQFHRDHDQLSVLVVTTDQVYNEFSSGLPDPAAIRNMSKMFYDRTKSDSSPFRYLLLMGDGSYDNRNFDGTKNNYVPTFQSQNSLNSISSFVSDDFFGLLDDDEGEANGYLDIGIGRIPCASASDAQLVVNKIKNYTNPTAMGSWRNCICFIADDEDNNSHMEDSESLAQLVEKTYPGFYSDKIYLDAYVQKSSADGDSYPDVTAAINERMDNGVLIVNYVGHANDEAMSSEKILGINDIEAWSNSKLPIFVTATCEFSRFDADDRSAGERVLMNSVGGGIGLFSTTRVVFSYSNFLLSQNFYKYVFEQDAKGENLRMGDVMRLAKVATLRDTNKRNFSLLADPALQLAFPKYEVKTLSIQGKDPAVDSIQISALEKVTITGEVVGVDGLRLTDFNGTLSPSIYDKEVVVNTLANDGGTSFSFGSRDNLIYQGSISVKNGYFEFSFIVPKDILYNVGEGKILYYVQNDEEDGNGATSQFLIGGTAQNAETDSESPSLHVYVNDEQFTNGDHVNSSALLMVDLFDQSGINTVGAGIGHDLVAYFDGDYTTPIVLNNYYTSTTDDYQSGRIVYPLTGMTEGRHFIEVKVWDVYNNSAKSTINFMVDTGFEISSVACLPTIVTEKATFLVKHTLPGERFSVEMNFYNMAGQKMTISEDVVVSDYSGEMLLEWTPDRQTFRPSSNPMVVYQVILTSTEGYKAEGTGKFFFKND